MTLCFPGFPVERDSVLAISRVHVHHAASYSTASANLSGAALPHSVFYRDYKRLKPALENFKGFKSLRDWVGVGARPL